MSAPSAGVWRRRLRLPAACCPRAPALAAQGTVSFHPQGSTRVVLSELKPECVLEFSLSHNSLIFLCPKVSSNFAINEKEIENYNVFLRSHSDMYSSSPAKQTNKNTSHVLTL